MTMTSLQQAFEWIRQDIPEAQLVGSGARLFKRVHTDSRSVKAGDLFVALVGERFDAHDFLPQLSGADLAGAIVQMGKAPAGMSAIEVPDTLQGMTALARHWRKQFCMDLIAVTGSNGKTTVTQMLASILRAQYGDDAMATTGNLNNEIGVPMMALRLRAHHKAAVLELGMNHPGEIARLAATAQPTVALVNNAQREHLEFMQTIDAVAQENGSVFKFLPQEGIAVYPGDDAFTPLWRQLSQPRAVIDFGGNASAVHLKKAHWTEAGWAVQVQTPRGVLAVNLPILGRHNLRNALAAIASAMAANVPTEAIVQGLAAFRAVKGRSAYHVLRRPEPSSALYVIDDTYNANPDSVRAAIDVLADLPAPRVLILADMGEVGNQGPAFHAEAGEYAKAKGIDALWSVGQASKEAVLAFGAGAQHFEDKQLLTAHALAQASKVGSVLVKGSRFMRMEEIVHALLSAEQGGAA